MTRSMLFVLALALTLPLGARPAAAELDWDLSGRLQTDLRVRVDGKALGEWYNRLEVPRGISRNENIAKLRLAAEAGRFYGVAEIDFVWLGYSRDVVDFGGLLQHEQIEPYRLEAHALYAEANDLFLDGLDLRLGMQKVMWGKGDQFNPTNTLNPNDLEDQLLFGDQLANAMVRLDYSPKEDWTFSAVLVPIFKPALLPASAELGLAALDRVPIVEQQLRWQLSAEKALAAQFGYPAVLTRSIPVLPEARLDNMQGAVRLAGVVAEQDIALSYYVGRSDMPQPFVNYSEQQDNPRCDPSDATRCVQGIVNTEVSVFYPRMQVLGFNMAGQINPLGWISRSIKPLGYRLELGVFFPQESSLILLQDEMFGMMPAGEYPYGPAGRPHTVDDTPFAKWVLGLDYTFNRYLYANVQWVHGLVDEFGAGDFISDGWAVRRGSIDPDANLASCALFGEHRGEQCAVEILRPRLGDYFVIGLDLKLLSDKLLSRLFMIFDLNGVYETRWDPDAGDAGARTRAHHGMFTSAGFSAVIFPEVTYSFGHGFELSAGALIKLGKPETKFGDPAAGGSDVWTRARFSF